MLVQLDRMKKEYDGFSLELNMEIPENQIIGLIGANGAGKSTTFKLMLGLIRPDEGNVEIFGRNAAEMGAEDKQKIGAAFSDSGFSEYLKVQQLIPIMSRFYPDFQEEEFRGRCERFKIPLNKQIKEFSTGMKAKLNVLLALSHDSRLLILDEPTAGLDVVAREEILDLLREYMEIPGRSIVISSHISGDLEHFCDDLYMIHEGKIVLHEETDRILEEYGFLKVSEQEYEALDKEYLLRVRKESFGYSCLTNQKNYYLENYPGIIVEKGSVDEVQFGIPLFANIHLCGSVLTEVFFCMTISKMLYGSIPAPGTMVLFCLLLGIFALGAPGVPGGTVMASLGIITGVLGFNETGTALMLTIFALQDSFGTACNVTGDGALTLILTGYAKKHNIKEQHLDMIDL